MLNEIRTMLGSTNGGRYIDASDGEVTGEFFAIVVNNDCVFSALEVEDTSVLASRNLAGHTITAGIYLGSGFHYENGRSKFNKIQLASGSVIAY